MRERRRELRNLGRNLEGTKELRRNLKEGTKKELCAIDAYLNQVVEHGGLSQEGVAAVEDGLHPSLVGVSEGVWGVALHVTPHLLILLHFRVPGKRDCVGG